MATNSFQSLHHHHHSIIKFQSLDTATSRCSLFLKPTIFTTSSATTTNNSLSLSISSSSSTTTAAATFSVSSATSTTLSTSQAFSLDLLHHHLSTQNFRQADEETRRLIIILAGEAAQKRGYIFFSEVQFIPAEDLKAIDDLWRQHSNNKFGYSVQKKIWQQKSNKDFTKFFINVGWMKKLDTEVEQFNYRAFPNEFIWELNDDTPEGHLPLTNALRGTQLLNSILLHPAFEDEEEDDEEESKVGDGDAENGRVKRERSSKPLGSTLFKPDYSF